MKKLAASIGVLVLLTWGAGAWATTYSGTEGDLVGSPAGGIGASGNDWTGTGGSTTGKGVNLVWTVDNTTNAGYWTYTYIFTTGSATSLDHYILRDYELRFELRGDPG